MLLTGCRKQPVTVLAPSPIRSYIDLEPGWRLTVITPLSPGFERTHYQVLPQGLAWQQSIRTQEGKEIQASAPELNLFPKPASKTHLRMLFLTRACR